MMYLVLDRERVFYCGKAGFCQNSSLFSSNSQLFSSNNEKFCSKPDFPSLRILSRSGTIYPGLGRVEVNLGQHSNHQKLILTIPKKGYQWSPGNVKSAELDNLTSGPKLQNNVKSYFVSLLLVIVSVLVLITSFLWLTNKLTEIKHVPILLLPIESYGENMESDKNTLEYSLRKNILETQSIRFLSKLALLDNSPYSIVNTKHHYKALWAIEARIRKLQDASKNKRVSLNLIDTRTGLEVYTKSIGIEGDLNSA